MDLGCGKGKYSYCGRKNLHHHVFHEERLIKLFEHFDIEVLKMEELYENYWTIGKMKAFGDIRLYNSIGAVHRKVD